MRLFDSHAHLDDKSFRDDLHEIMARAREAGVEQVLTVGAEFGRWGDAIEIAHRHEGVVAAVGCHPHDARLYTDDAERQLRQLCADQAVVAWGEIGLDFHYDNSPRDDQRRVFQRQLEIARTLDLPVILHIREAMPEAVTILRECAAGDYRGVAHCFSGDERDAGQLLDLGFHISLAGPLTFKKSEQLKAVARMLPEDRLLTETDCPYLAPHPMRGPRNEPALVRHTLLELASQRSIEPEHAADLARNNAKRLFSV